MYWGKPRLWPSHNIFLHLDLSQASSLQSPFSLISSFNTSLHLFLGLPFTPWPSTCSVPIIFIQHNSSLLSTWPNHLSLFRRMTLAVSSIASMLLTHSLLFLSLKFTPVIHFNILISLLWLPPLLFLPRIVVGAKFYGRMPFLAPTTVISFGPHRTKTFKNNPPAWAVHTCNELRCTCAPKTARATFKLILAVGNKLNPDLHKSKQFPKKTFCSETVFNKSQ